MMNKNQGTPCEIQVKFLLATQQKALINHRKIIYLPHHESSLSSEKKVLKYITR